MKTCLLVHLTVISCCACSQIENLDQVVPHSGNEGRSVAAVEINSAPSAAWIYVDDVFIGTTPVVHEFHFDHRDRSIDVVAEPLPGNTAQMRQRRSFSLPPLPTRVHFNMNNPNRLNNYE